jgi:hypothetical protein
LRGARFQRRRVLEQFSPPKVLTKHQAQVDACWGVDGDAAQLSLALRDAPQFDFALGRTLSGHGTKPAKDALLRRRRSFLHLCCLLRLVFSDGANKECELNRWRQQGEPVFGGELVEVWTEPGVRVGGQEHVREYKTSIPNFEFLLR